MSVTTPRDVEKKEQLNRAMAEGHDSYMKLLQEEFHDAGWLAPEALKGMWESDDFYCSFFGQVRSPKLCSGRVVLLGDAGYATPGFGTSLAIIGGYVLAGELLNHHDDAPAALQAYEDLMLPFVKKSQGDDYMMQRLNPQTEWGIWLRDLVLKFITGLRIDRMVIAIMALVGATEGKVDLPKYPWRDNKAC
jgi:2-polyprenyl-6-methoxyphenol hydroxylase-like FAD-dependent oxidoreductase